MITNNFAKKQDMTMMWFCVFWFTKTPQFRLLARPVLRLVHSATGTSYSALQQTNFKLSDKKTIFRQAEIWARQLPPASLSRRKKGKFPWVPRRLEAPPSLKNIKYTRMCHFKKATCKIILQRGPAKMFFFLALRPFRISNVPWPYSMDSLSQGKRRKTKIR